MDYDQSIQDTIDVLKADKSVVQPWRNYALKALNEAQAFIRMGKTTTYRDPDDGTPADPNTATCTCPQGGLKRSCPVHGE